MRRDTFSVDFRPYTNVWDNWKFSDDAPGDKRMVTRSIDAAAQIDMIRERAQFAAEDPGSLQSDPVLLGGCAREKQSTFDGEADSGLLLKYSILQNSF